MWVDWPGGPFNANNQTLNVSSLGLPGGAYITDVQWDFGTVAIDFSATTAPRILGRVINPDHDGNPVNDSDSMSNTAQVDWTYQGVPDTLSDTQTDQIRQPIAAPAPQKDDVSTGPYIPSSVVRYSLRVMAQSSSPSVLTNPIVMELLPTGLQYVPGSWSFNPGSTGAPSPRRPLLTGLVAAPPNVTVYYSTSSNPCRPEIISSSPAGCTPPNWSTLPPAEITSVHALRFDFAGILNPR